MSLVRTLLLFLAVFSLDAGKSALAQKTPYLERLVTLKASNQTLAQVFQSVSAQTGTVFSYTGFNDQERVSVNYYKKPLRTVLNSLLTERGCTYKLKDKYIILSCGSKPRESVKPEIRLTGYVYSAADSSQVPQASIYIRENKHSSQTNPYGYFSMSFPNTASQYVVSVACSDYRDTSIVVRGKSVQEVVLYLLPERPAETAEILPAADTLDAAAEPEDSMSIAAIDSATRRRFFPGFRFWDKFEKTNANLRNISDTLFSDVSFSVIPGISTNRLLSVNTVSKFSFNLFAGYSKGIDGFELGGLANIDHGDVRYGQIGGLANIVSGNFTGGQVGGLVNFNSGTTFGAQVGGLLNLNKGDTRYVQVGGIGNVNLGSFTGVQVGGIFNQNNRHVRGIQVGGILNQQPSFDGIQIAGIVNQVTHHVRGIQLSGILNAADTVKGMQLSGLINASRNTKGAQIGFLNASHRMQGLQLGFLNVSNTCNGVPIGFISYVHRGYHKLELASDEMLLGTLAFRTGVDPFHNIFLGGLGFGNSRNLWTFGYGVGSAMRLSKKWYLDLDITSQQLLVRNSDFIDLHLLNKAFLGVEFRPVEKINVAIGPTYNLSIADTGGADYQTIRNSLSASSFFDRTEGDLNFRMWIGGKIALRFL